MTRFGVSRADLCRDGDGTPLKWDGTGDDMPSVTGWVGDLELGPHRRPDATPSAQPELNPYDTEREAVLAEARVVLAEQIPFLREHESATAALIALLGRVQRRIDDLLPFPPLTTPLAPQLDSAALQAIKPVDDDAITSAPAPRQVSARQSQPVTAPEAQSQTAWGAQPDVLVDRPDRPVPTWRGAPVVQSGHISRLISQFKLAGSAARLVALTPPTSVVILRAWLPPGLAVQPDGDGANSTTVLLYSYLGDAPDAQALRVPYRLVDMLSLLSLDRCLTPNLHQALDLQLQQQLLPLERGLEEHMVARARWRRTVPTVKGELEALLSQTSLAARSQLAHLLVQVSGEDPRTGTRLPELLGTFRLPIPSEAWVNDVISRTDEAAAKSTSDLLTLGRPTFDPLPPSPTLAPRLAAGLDMERIAATRASTILARQKLLDLDEHAEDDRQHPQAERSDMPAAASGEPLQGALAQLARQLGTQKRHVLSDIREVATQLGLVPLDAIRTINEWAEARSPSSDSLPDVLIEVDEASDAVWVEPLLKELLT